MKLVLRPLTNCSLHRSTCRLKLNHMLVIHGLSTCTKLQLIHCHAQEKTIDNRFLRNEIRIHSGINCKQMASVNVKMVEHLISLQDFLEQHSQKHGQVLHQETQLQSHTAEY